ncbi:DUF3617 family protein [Acidobacteria bacterium AB60]|nr:DUF3617 family protein [Acidobacteria bacterium AB60]
MRHIRLYLALGGWLLVGTLAMTATPNRKPGLWQITTTMTWQKAPEVAGSDAAKLQGGTHTTEVCLTQEMIDDYGALLPHDNGMCKIQNRVTSDAKTTGEYVCNGVMDGKGELESTWVDPGHVKGKVHFNGTFQVGSERQTVEWTTDSLSEFKSSSCGAVKPHPLGKH